MKGESVEMVEALQILKIKLLRTRFNRKGLKLCGK